MRLKPYLLEIAKEGGLTRRGHGEALSGIVLAGWGTLADEGDDRCISNDELREVLLRTGDDFRSQALWHAERWSTKNDDEDNRWTSLVVELLTALIHERSDFGVALASG
jgi:hypothetical protein